ncbi:beta-glucosidase BglX [Dysgonomonas sp. UBA7698]|uniref:beta-glucosidase BglX n=1 Tax=Dysgonomonas sp. UBA7698 TaxID=1946427 RepID=UPI0025C0341E|nr:beta-glucosidase BglX [Dysgonomonas sp. UBA7698]
MRRIFASILSAFVILAVSANDGEKKTSPQMDKFISDLISKMTLEEKIGQLHLISGTDAVSGETVSNQSKVLQQIKAGKVGAFINAKGAAKVREIQRVAIEETRMKIPLLFGMDFAHGYETIFPISYGSAASWNMEAIKESAHIAAVEASADGLNWIYSPMVDITRDARWGRIAEGAGEDPYLGGQIAKALVKGYQGEPAYANNTNIMACVKHFGLYGASEAGRDYSVVDMSKVRMYNEYFEPYKAAVEAGVGSVMSSFNEVEGIPATANKWLLTDVLRNQWGFDGFVVTDYASIGDIIRFGVSDYYGASVMSLKAGTDLDMESYGFTNNLKNALEKGDITENEINIACRRILEAKYKLGLFSDPYKYCDPKRPEKDIKKKEHREAARKLAGESFVLLKNDKNILPLKKNGKIALIGPHGNNRPNMLGSWGWPSNLNMASTVMEGLKDAVGDKATVSYARGCQPYGNMEHEVWLSLTKDFEKDGRSNTELLAEALKLAKESDVIVATLGESSEMSGESSSRSDINIPAPQKELLKELVATGKPVVLVLFTGRPLTIKWESENVPAILNVWFPGSEGAYAIADALFGDVNPSGKLTSSWPQDIGQVPIYYNIKKVSKPMDKWFQKFRSGYLDISNEPLYPFGYGLSYTTFEYGDIILSDTIMNKGKSLTASVDITNTGKVAGSEIVQLYIQDMVSSITRPVKELKGFEKIYLKAGETKRVNFTINEDLLKFYNYNLDYVSEPGDFQIMVGRNSSDVKNLKFTLK